MRRWLLIAGALGFVAAMSGQNTPLPRFTTASVTPTDEHVHYTGASAFVVNGQRIDAHSVPVGALVTEGWHLHPYQIIWPVQALNALYNVSATMPKGTTPEIRSLLFQQLLADRFGFRYHREMKETPAYALEIAPGGLKMRSVAPPPAGSVIINQTENNSWHMFRVARAPSAEEPASRMQHLNVFSIDELMSNMRAPMFGRNELPVIDQTGLPGYFSFDLYVPCAADGCRMKEWSDAVFFDVLEKQLGLRGVRKTMPVKMLVIDHVERVRPSGP